MKKQLLVVQNLSYGDATAYLFLWLKTVMLVPLWAIPIIPIVGFISRGFGHGAVQVIYGLTLLSLVIYFMVDVLKRRIRLDDHYLFFGIRAIPIASINSIDVLYKKSSFLPTHFAIATSSGERLKLSHRLVPDRPSSGLVLDKKAGPESAPNS